MLNGEQRRVFRNGIKILLDGIVDAGLAEWLPRSIEPVRLTPAEAMHILTTEYLDHVADATNIPEAIRNSLLEFKRAVAQRENVPANVLQILQSQPNYDPIKLAHIKQFEEQIRPLNEQGGKYLLILRLTYLEMTPFDTHQFIGNYREFHYRIGGVPFNLDTFGPRPTPGEITIDTLDFVGEYSETFQAFEKEKKAKETAEKEFKATQAVLQLNEETIKSLQLALEISQNEIKHFWQKRERHLEKNQELANILETRLQEIQRQLQKEQIKNQSISSSIQWLKQGVHKDFQTGKRKTQLDLLHGKLLNNQEIFFQEQIITSGKRGNDCGFNAIGVSRQEIKEKLLLLVEDKMARQSLCEEIQDALVSNQFSDENWQKLIEERHQKYEGQAAILREIKASIHASNADKMNIEELMEWNDSHQQSEKNGKLVESILATFHIEQKIESCLQSSQLFEKYVTGLGEELWLGIPSAMLYAKSANLSLYIWQKQGDNKLVLFKHYDAAGSQIVHIVFTSRFSHFNRLIECADPQLIATNLSASNPAILDNAATATTGFYLRNPHQEHLALIADIKAISIADDYAVAVKRLRETLTNYQWFDKKLLTKIQQPANLLDQKIKQNLLNKFINKGKEHLDANHKIFAPIQALCKELRKLKSSMGKNKLTSSLLIETIEHLLKLYTDYVSEVLKPSANYLHLLQPLVQLKGVGIGDRFLSRPTACQILNLDEKLRMLKKDESVPGNHVVTQVGNTFYKNNHKLPIEELLSTLQRDSNLHPAIEHAVCSLSSVISKQGVAPTTFLKIIFDNTVYYVQASKAVHGIRLDQYLKNPLISTSSFPVSNYSASFITNLLVRFSDSKPDNYIVTEERSHTGKLTNVNLVGIDNDMAFVYPIYKKNNKHYLNLWDIVFCLPQANEQFDGIFLEYFLSRSAESMIFEWLVEILQQESYFRELEAEGLLTSEEKKIFQIPIKFLPGEIARIYNTILKMQTALGNNRKMSHTSLFALLEPLSQRLYSWALSKADKNPLKALSILRWGFRASTANNEESITTSPTFEDALTLTESEREELIQIDYKDYDYVNNRSLNLMKAIGEFIQNMDFGQLSILQQGYILDYLRDFHDLTSLHFQNCAALNDDYLRRLNIHFPKLKNLALLNCPQITIYGLAALLRRSLPITLRLGQCEQIKVGEWSILFQHCQEFGHQFRIHFSNHSELLVNLENPLLLHQAMDGITETREDPEIIQFLIQQGAQLNSRDAYQRTPLHCAARQGNFAAVNFLLQAGAVIECKDEKTETALEKALNYGHNCISAINGGEGKLSEIEEDLVNQASQFALIALALNAKGAYCQQGKGVIINLCRFILKLLPQYKVLATAYVEYLVRNKLLDDSSLSVYLPYMADNTNLNFRACAITDKGLAAILDVCNHIQCIDITDCELITRNGMELISKKSISAVILDFDQAQRLQLIPSVGELSNFNELYMGQTHIIIQSLTVNRLGKQFIAENEEASVKLVKLLSQFENNCTLKYLNLDGYPITPKIAQVLTKILNTSVLKYLSLNRVTLNDESVKILVDGLSKNQTLHVLDIGNNKVSDLGIMLLYQAIREQQQLHLLAIFQKSISVHSQIILDKLEQQQQHLRISYEDKASVYNFDQFLDINVASKNNPLLDNTSTPFAGMAEATSKAGGYAHSISQFSSIISNSQLNLLQAPTETIAESVEVNERNASTLS